MKLFHIQQIVIVGQDVENLTFVRNMKAKKSPSSPKVFIPDGKHG